MDQLIEETTSPRLISTGDINDIHELCLASEGMVVCKFRPPSILSAVATLLGSFYCFNMGVGGSEKKHISVFRAHAVRSD